jgi:hypothetical protein
LLPPRVIDEIATAAPGTPFVSVTVCGLEGTTKETEVVLAESVDAFVVPVRLAAWIPAFDVTLNVPV